MAIKIFKRDEKESLQDLQTIIWEVEVMMALKNDRHVVEFKDLFVSKNFIVLVMEKLDMNLYTYLKSQQEKLTEQDI